MEAIITAFTTAITTIAGDAMNVAAAVVPVALPVAGVGIALSVGFRLLKKLTK